MSKSNHGFLSGNGYQMNQFGPAIHDTDSSSQSDQSHQEASAVSESSLNELHTSMQSDDGREKHNKDTVNSVASMGKQGSAFLSPKYNQPFACIPYTGDGYYGGVLTGYAPQAIVYSQQNDTSNSRVPLAIEPAAEEPIYVNAKQYHAILRRRQIRAKLEAENKLVKGRKPYLHESRHRHAMKRARGSGGRFLNSKELQEQTEQRQVPGGSSSSNVIDNNMRSQSGPSLTPLVPAASDTASVPRANQEHTCFPSASFHPTMSFSTQDGAGDTKLALNGVQQCVSFIR